MNMDTTPRTSAGTPDATWLASLLAKQNPQWLARYVAFRRRIQQMTRSKRRWLLKRAAVSVTGAALLLALSQAPAAHAATITVTTNLPGIVNDSLCSLSEAITNANDTTTGQPYTDCAAGDPSGADTIVLAGNTYTYTASYGGVQFGAATAVRLVESEITIEGNGATIERDAGAISDFRILAVSSGGDLTLNDTTISGGDAGVGNGGGIYATGDLALNGSTVTGNEAFLGGGLFLLGGTTVTLNNSLVTQNSAYSSGGGFSAIDVDMTLENGTAVTLNTATGYAGGRINDGTLTINNSSIDDNDASFRAGGLFSYKSTVNILNGSTISGNESLGAIGGARFSLSNVTINDSTISGNTAAGNAGGLFIDGSIVTIDNSTIDDNEATYNAYTNSNGGGLYIGAGYDYDLNSDVDSDVTITASSISGNTAYGRGGGIKNASELHIDTSLIDDNRASNREGGGIFNDEDATVTITASTISRNYGKYDGGGVYNAGLMTITNSLITGNNGGDGGGLYNDDSTATTTITDSVITDNTARDQGGGLYNDFGTLNVISSTVSGNRAGQEGGGVYTNGSTTITNIVNSTISGNTAVAEGGGIYHNRGTLTITNSTITGNSADEEGGGLYMHLSSAEATIIRSIISGNSAVAGDEVYNNDNGPITADANNVFGDSSQSNADAFYNFTPGASDFNATTDGTPTALANILDTTLQNNGGPTFTHALVSGSPAIDFGPTAACAADPVYSVDQRGEPRSIDIPGEGNDGGANLCDSGAFEVQLPPVSACPVDVPGVGLEQTSLLGTGMGNPTRSRMVAKIVIPSAADVTELYGQMAAKEYNGVRFVRFIFGDKSYQQVPTDGGTFDIGQTAAISWWGDDLTAGFQSQVKPFVKGRWFLHKGMKKMKLPRAIVVYPTHTTTDEYANAWSTFGAPTNFVAGTPGFDQTNSNILSIPETQATTDITVQLAVTDVNRDARSVDVIVRAGGVEVTTTLTSPTNKKSELLEIFEVTLEDVPAGVDEVVIELVSILDAGDSAALLGAAASFACELPSP